MVLDLKGYRFQIRLNNKNNNNNNRRRSVYNRKSRLLCNACISSRITSAT
jgi:hypothetical protein